MIKLGWCEDALLISNAETILQLIHKSISFKDDPDYVWNCLSCASDFAIGVNKVDVFFDLFREEFVDDNIKHCTVVAAYCLINNNAELLSKAMKIIANASKSIPYKKLLIDYSKCFEERKMTIPEKEVFRCIMADNGNLLSVDRFVQIYKRLLIEKKQQYGLEIANILSNYFSNDVVIYEFKSWLIHTTLDNNAYNELYDSTIKLCQKSQDAGIAKYYIPQIVCGEYYYRNIGVKASSLLVY